jgi:hypothetical protein
MRLYSVLTRYRLADGRTLAQPFDVGKHPKRGGFSTNQPLGFALSPISTSRRMASGRPGRSSCLRRQSSISETESVEIRTLIAMVSTGGLPRFVFLALSIIDFMVL